MIALVFGILLARILSPSEFGVVAVANIVIQYANNFTNFGLNNALIQKEDVAREHVDAVFTIDLFISCLLMVGTFLFSNKIALFFHNRGVGPVLRWMSIYYVITTFYNIPVVILRRAIDFRFMTIVEFIEALLASGLTLSLAFMGFSYWSIVISTLAVPIVIATVFMRKTRWTPRLAFIRDMQDLYSFGFWNFIRNQVQLLVAKVDYFAIGRFLNVAALGIYEKSFELTQRAMTGLTMPINGIFFSTFSRLQNDTLQVRQVFLEASGLLALVSYPVLLGLAAVAPHFVGSCLGEKWMQAVMPIQVLAIGSMFRVQLGMVTNVNVVMGKYRQHTVYNIITAIVFITFCFLLVRRGVVAICFAYLFYCALSLGVSFWISAKIIKLSLAAYGLCLWCPLVGAMLMMVSVIILQTFFFTDQFSFLQFLCLVTSGGLVYLGWCFCFYRLGFIRLAISGRYKTN